MFVSPTKYRQLRPTAEGAKKQRGFSLIEFLVASGISMIVLIAAGSTYFMTRQLTQVSSERLVAQQDLRNAATLIIRDARQAGTFGCANLADTGSTAQVQVSNPYNTINPDHPLALRGDINDNQPNGFGIRTMPGSNFIAANAANIANFTPLGNALIFVYGDGYASITGFTPSAPSASSPAVSVTGLQIQTDTNGSVTQAITATGTSPIVISSCNQVQIMRKGSEYSISGTNQIQPSTTLPVASAHTTPGAFLAGQMNISKLTGSAYLIGRPAGSTNNGLYRFYLAADGTWAGPQLLVSNIADTDGMTLQFGYVKTNTCIDGASNPAETFTFRTTTETIADHSKLPALLRITLKVKDGDQRAANIDIGTVSDYVIDASVRNGNVCANRGMGS